MSLFPTRPSQRDFLAYYSTLADDDLDDDGIDLFAGAPDDDDDDDDDAYDLRDLIANGGDDKDDSRHKSLDAARRAAEEKELEALALRFEQRAGDDGPEYGLSEQAQQVQAARRARARAARECEVAREREVAREEALERARMDEAAARKREVLQALFAPCEELSETEPSTGMLPSQPPPTHAANPKEKSEKTERYRIPKKKKA